MLDPNDQYWWAAPLCYKNVRMSDVFGCTAFLPFQDVETRNTKKSCERNTCASKSHHGRQIDQYVQIHFTLQDQCHFYGPSI